MSFIRQLIHDYCTAVSESFAEMLAEYPAYKRIPRDLQIPRQGTLGSGRTYSFHGIGCRFEKDGVVADMDFGIVDGELRSDGFDAWRLHKFAKSRGDSITIEEIESALDELCRCREIMKAGSESGSGLYFPRPSKSQ